MIKKILRSKLKVGYIIENQIKKDPGSAVIYKAFKVDKRNDGWIEIRDAEKWDLWGLVKRIETPYGALYLGFGLNRRPLAFFRPYKDKINNIRKVVRQINRKYRFIKLSWCALGGNEEAKLYNLRVEIVNLYNFILFLAPIPKDVANIIAKIKRPKITGVRIISEVFILIKEANLTGKLTIREIIKLFTGYVLLVKRRVIDKRGKREILGGYIPSFLPLTNLSFGLNLKNNVWSSKTPMVMVCIQGGFAKILQLQIKNEEEENDDRSGYAPA